MIALSGTTVMPVKAGTLYSGMASSGVRATLSVASISTAPARSMVSCRSFHVDGFTTRCMCKHLVGFEIQDRVDAATLQEKRMKEWRRAWKVREIEAANPGWNDLYPTPM